MKKLLTAAALLAVLSLASCNQGTTTPEANTMSGTETMVEDTTMEVTPDTTMEVTPDTTMSGTETMVEDTTMEITPAQ